MTHIGPSQVTIARTEYQLHVVVAGGDAEGAPADRPVLAIGEAKAGETVGLPHLRHLERVHTALGPNATGARLLFFAPLFTDDLRQAAAGRSDTELVDLGRLYRGT